jgi:chemotaxis response regulator CheB
MPESAIATGFVDFIQTPEDIAKTISHLANEVK